MWRLAVLRSPGQPLGSPVIDVGEGIGHADAVVGGVLEVVGEAELEVEVTRPRRQMNLLVSQLHPPSKEPISFFIGLMLLS